ncbi:MAG: hypothetical protein JWP87_6493 [Labilithrix sp.]|nr:hypothetical protein [Labilithrix sp.]
MSKRITTGLALATWFAAAGIVATGSALCSACSSPDSTQLSPLDLPDKTQFMTQGVGLFMEKRCGALDCHGQIGRPLRIYSANGLRKNDGPNGTRDTRPTTADESLANYYSVVGLEPEEISIAHATKGEFIDFLLLKKPLGIDQGGVRHKGGSVLRSTDPGFDCLITWVSGNADKAKCDDGAAQ